MTTQLRQWFTGFFNSLKPLNPEQFGDPWPLQTKWTSMANSNATFNMHYLTRPSPYRYEFQATMASKLFSVFFICIGGGIVIGGILSNQYIGMGLVGLGFSGVGLLFLLQGTQPIVFDQQSGFFWERGKSREHLYSELPSRKPGFSPAN